jgi:hypothetical protein
VKWDWSFSWFGARTSGSQFPHLYSYGFCSFSFLGVLSGSLKWNGTLLFRVLILRNDKVGLENGRVCEIIHMQQVYVSDISKQQCMFLKPYLEIKNLHLRLSLNVKPGPNVSPTQMSFLSLLFTLHCDGLFIFEKNYKCSWQTIVLMVWMGG